MIVERQEIQWPWTESFERWYCLDVPSLWTMGWNNFQENNITSRFPFHFQEMEIERKHKTRSTHQGVGLNISLGPVVPFALTKSKIFPTSCPRKITTTGYLFPFQFPFLDKDGFKIRFRRCVTYFQSLVPSRHHVTSSKPCHLLVTCPLWQR